MSRYQPRRPQKRPRPDLGSGLLCLLVLVACIVSLSFRFHKSFLPTAILTPRELPCCVPNCTASVLKGAILDSKAFQSETVAYPIPLENARSGEGNRCVTSGTSSNINTPSFSPTG